MKRIISFVALLSFCFLAIVSCKKKSDPEPTPVPTTTPPPTSTTWDINSSYQVSFSFDGTTVSYISPNPALSMAYGTDHSLSGFGSGPSTFKYDATLMFSSSAGKSFTIKKGTITLPMGGAPETNAQFLGLFSIGTSPYSPDGDNGVVLTYSDGTTDWSTSNGAADQTGSVFTIVDRKEITGSSSDYTVKVYATFNCKLYDLDGHVKTVTGGKIILDFQKFM